MLHYCHTDASKAADCGLPKMDQKLFEGQAAAEYTRRLRQQAHQRVRRSWTAMARR
jgi:hypothetical protein